MDKSTQMKTFCLFLFLIIASPVSAAGNFKAGFRTIGHWIKEPELRMDVNVWYPTQRQTREINYPPYIIQAASNAKIADGRFPLIVISHATPANRFSYHNLAAFLASRGFIVAAPTHPRDSMDNMEDLFTWQQLSGRCREISTCIDLIAADPNMRQSFLSDKVGVTGFGAGASAALLLGGALPNCDNWPHFCSRAPKENPYCQKRTKSRIDAICNHLPLKESLSDSRIKAIAAISPGYGMLFSDKSFKSFHPALLLVGAGKDTFNPPALNSEVLARFLGPKTSYLDMENADAGALLAPCPQALAVELPELCNSVSPDERNFFHQRLSQTLSAFFRLYLDEEPPQVQADTVANQPRK